MENESVISAYNLLKEGLLSETQFLETIKKILNKKPQNYNSNSSITEGQKNYISLLKQQGKIPENLEIDEINALSKTEAQVLIQNALRGKFHNQETNFKEVNSPDRQVSQIKTGEVSENSVPANIPKELESLYEKEEDY